MHNFSRLTGSFRGLHWSIMGVSIFFNLSLSNCGLAGVQRSGKQHETAAVAVLWKDRTIHRIQTGLRTTSTCWRKAGLRIYSSKVNTVPCTREFKLDHLRAIRFHGMQMERVTDVKYFGIIVDYKLLWKTLLKAYDELQVQNRTKVGLNCDNALIDIYCKY